MWLYNHVGLIFLSMGIFFVGLLTIFYIKTIMQNNEKIDDAHMNANNGLMKNKGKI